jgi:uncharacterized protein (TIGR02246 family)
MTLQHGSGIRLLVFGGLAVAASWFAVVSSRPGHAGQTTPARVALEVAPAVSPAQQKVPDERAADRDAVQKALDSFTAAFGKGDAKVVAGHWTPDGEYVSDDGTTIRGRAALEKDYAEFFVKNPDNALEVEVDTIRFPSRDTAVVEGHFKLHMGKKKELVVSRCSFLYAREDGKWLIAIAREWPGDGFEIRDLEWLIGTWEAKRDGTVVSTKYEWTANKVFIRCQFSVTKDGKTETGMQVIGKMPSTGELHTWTFEDAGGIGDSDISRDGKKWKFAARGSTAEGKVITATNIMTPIDADTFTWQSVERTLDGEALPDQPPVKVTRLKGKQ